jgi:subtilisin family serine protease
VLGELYRLHQIQLVIVGAIFALVPWTAPILGFAEPYDVSYVPNEVIVRFKDASTRTARDLTIEDLGGTHLRSFDLPGLELHRISGMSVEEAVEQLAGHPLVEYVEPNYIVEALRTPNDPSFAQQWSLHNTGQSGGTPGADISATDAWNITTHADDVVVGVIDTGVDWSHPDLAANIYENPGEIAGNQIDDDNNGFVDDVRGWDFINNDNNPFDDAGHGTHVAGTIGAIGNNGVGVAGVAWGVKIMPLKFLGSGGSGSTADAISAVEYATMMNVHLTNNSWGGGSFSQGLRDAIEAANAAGILFVAAAGNAGVNNDLFPHYPSSYTNDNIVAVANSDHNDVLWPSSSFGQTSVDLAAPGTNILSTVPERWRWSSGVFRTSPGLMPSLCYSDPSTRFQALQAPSSREVASTRSSPLPSPTALRLQPSRTSSPSRKTPRGSSWSGPQRVTTRQTEPRADTRSATPRRQSTPPASTWRRSPPTRHSRSHLVIGRRCESATSPLAPPTTLL